MYILPETDLIKLKEESSDKNSATFVIEPLLPGYGMTIGNAMRRVLLSSLNGSAVTSVHIDGATHEFTSIKGVKEDIVEIVLNLKNLDVKLFGDEPVIVKLTKKGPGRVTAGDFTKNSDVEFTDPNYIIANLDKQGSLSLEITVEKGRGYLPTEKRMDEKLPLGTIAVDSIFTPIRRVQYDVENTRVGGMTNFDKLILEISTDGTVSAREAFKNCIQILVDHFSLITSQISEETKIEKVKTSKTKVSAKKTVKEKKTK
jgi:DNA-directed RNA polymerase subunit alpha